MGFYWDGRPQGRHPAAVFYPLGHPMPHAHASINALEYCCLASKRYCTTTGFFFSTVTLKDLLLLDYLSE
jgi:hypothetical protein